MSAPRLLAPTTISGGIPTAGAGTANTIALWTPDNFTLGNSLLTQAGNVTTNSGTFRTADGSNTEPGYTFTNSSGSGMYRRSSGSILAFSASGAFAFGISSSQRMYIGTAATAVPTERLEIGGGLRIAGAANVATATGSQPAVLSLEFPVTRLYTGDGTGYTFAVSKRNFSVTTDMLVVNDVNGYVGIGTASPVTTLANTASAIDDGANGVATTGLTWSPNAVGFAAGFWNKYGAVGNGLFVRTSDTSSSTRVFHVCAGAGAVPNSLLFVRGDGNVGIGTASPGAKLEIPFSGTAAGCRIQFASGPFNYFNATNHYFRTLGDADVMTIVSTNVGIGTTGPDSRLHVTLAGLASLRIGYAGTSVNYYDAGTHNFRDGGGNPAFTITAGATKIADLSVSGWGLKLPATPGNTDPNTIDAYVDGGASAGGVSWTPTLSAAATWGGTAPTVTNARYTRVGNMVFCTVTLDTTGGAAFSSTYGSSTITAPAGISAAVFTSVPSNRGGVSANGAQSGTTIFVPTYASSVNVINITWFYAV